VLITKPSITEVKLNKQSDFMLLGCDGIFDRLENEDIFKLIWSFKRKGKTIDNIHKLSADITDCVIKYSMKKRSEDNVTIIFFAFQNFYDRMKDEEFEYKYNGNSCKYIGGELDLGL
jgi:protein phosphatase 2C family protein 2/3